MQMLSIRTSECAIWEMFNLQSSSILLFCTCGKSEKKILNVTNAEQTSTLVCEICDNLKTDHYCNALPTVHIGLLYFVVFY